MLHYLLNIIPTIADSHSVSHLLDTTLKAVADTAAKAVANLPPIQKSQNETTSFQWVLIIIGFVVSFCSGGFAGAYYTRRQTLKDREAERKLPKLTLKTIQEKATLGSTSIYKEFELINNTTIDVDSCEIVFEFDENAVIVKDETKSKQGTNKLEKNPEKQNLHKYTIVQLNREERVIFIFHIDKFSENKCRVFINCKGVGLVCIDRNIIDLPSITPNKFEAPFG